MSVRVETPSKVLIQELTLKLDQLASHARHVDEIKETYIRQIENLESQLKETVDQSRLDKKQIEDLKTAKNSLQCQRDDLVTKMASHKEELEALQGRVNQQTVSQENHEAKANELEQECAQLQEELERRTSELNEAIGRMRNSNFDAQTSAALLDGITEGGAMVGAGGMVGSVAGYAFRIISGPAAVLTFLGSGTLFGVSEYGHRRCFNGTSTRTYSFVSSRIPCCRSRLPDQNTQNS